MNRLINRFCVLFGRQYTLNRLRTAPVLAWPLIERVWAGAGAVFSTIVGSTGRMPFERRLAFEMGTAGDDAEALLWQNLQHPNPQVAAYCLLALTDRSKGLVKQSFIELGKRRDVIHLRAGCLFMNIPLGDFAKKLIECKRISDTTDVNFK